LKTNSSIGKTYVWHQNEFNTVMLKATMQWERMQTRSNECKRNRRMILVKGRETIVGRTVFGKTIRMNAANAGTFRLIRGHPCIVHSCWHSAYMTGYYYSKTWLIHSMAIHIASMLSLVIVQFDSLSLGANQQTAHRHWCCCVVAAETLMSAVAAWLVAWWCSADCWCWPIKLCTARSFNFNNNPQATYENCIRLHMQYQGHTCM
jgi:hypothetical protein